MELIVNVLLELDGSAFPSQIFRSYFFASLLLAEVAAIKPDSGHLNSRNFILISKVDLGLDGFNKFFSCVAIEGFLVSGYVFGGITQS